MTIRGIPLRAILLPVGVAAFSIVSLSWYGFVYIPSQQRYLNERNIRLLRILGPQIASKVNNFDRAMDNAAKSFRIDGKPVDSSKREEFAQYVKEFVPELNILDQDEEDEVLRKTEKHDELFDDPPRVKFVLDDNTHYLYLFYKLRVDSAPTPTYAKLSAKVDIEKLLSPELFSKTEFNTLAIVDFEGRVVAQSKSGVTLARFDRLAGAPSPTGAAATGFDTLKATGNIADVTIGGTDYKLYVQPVQLSLLREDGKTPEEWGLCGLVRADDFRGAGSAISPTYWVMLIAALAVLCLAIPLLKLHMLNPRERFHGFDGVLVAATTFLMAALLTFGLMDAQYFGRAFRNNIDGHLKKLAQEIAKHLCQEVEAVQLEMDERVKTLPPGYEKGASHSSILDRDPPQITVQGRKIICNPLDACDDEVIGDGTIHAADAKYPYFGIIAWADRSGQQRVKWTTKKGITPFIDDSDLPYHDDLDRALRFPTVVPHRGVSVLKSINTGKPLTVFWSTLRTDDSRGLAAVSIATTPLSVSNPVLPKDMQFAVLDATGTVLFHSDPTRNLNENFFRECGDNPNLQAHVLGRTPGTLTARYLGTNRRLFVTPIELADPVNEQKWSLKEPQWSLVVFQDLLVSETVNLETLVLAAVLFAAYALLLGGGWALLHFMWPQHTTKWFWPDSQKVQRYDWVGWLNLSLSVAFLAVFSREDPVPLLFTAALASLCALKVTFDIVRLSDLPKSTGERWHKHFLFARISFLLVVAAVPAIACFQVAYHFESNLLNRRGDIYLKRAVEARSDRIDQDIAQVSLCVNDKCSIDPVEFRNQRLKKLWDVHIIQSTDSEAASFVLQPDWLNRTLTFFHIAYNNVAGDLKQAAPGDQTQEETGPKAHETVDSSRVVLPNGTVLSSAHPAPTIQPGFSFWFVAIMVALGLALLFRFVVMPLFVLDAYMPPGVTPSHDGKLGSNLLLVGPPGSEKTTALKKNSGRLIFDVRSPSWLDDTKSLQLPNDGTIGIDHLEYRFGDSSFRDQLLAFLENLLYRRHHCVWIASTRNPIDQLNESGSPADVERWQRLFQSFRLESVGITVRPKTESVNEIKDLVRLRTGGKLSDVEDLILNECERAPWLLSIAKSVIVQLPPDTLPAPENVLFEIGVAAGPFYHAIWAACSKDEKLVLRQLAEEGVVNPRNARVTAHLLRSGIVRRDPIFRLMNSTFRAFVLQDVQSDGLAAWEHEGVRLPWGSIATTMLTIVLGLTGWLLLTWQQLVYEWIGYVPALAPAVPTVLKLLASIQRTPKSGIAA